MFVRDYDLKKEIENRKEYDKHEPLDQTKIDKLFLKETDLGNKINVGDTIYPMCIAKLAGTGFDIEVKLILEREFEHYQKFYYLDESQKELIHLFPHETIDIMMD